MRPLNTAEQLLDALANVHYFKRAEPTPPAWVRTNKIMAAFAKRQRRAARNLRNAARAAQ